MVVRKTVRLSYRMGIPFERTNLRSGADDARPRRTRLLNEIPATDRTLE